MTSRLQRYGGKEDCREEAGRGEEAAESADIGALSLTDEEGPGAEEQAEQAADDDDNSSLFDEPLRPDCDICMLPLPIAAFFQTYMPCCGKTLCCGCTQSNQLTIIKTNEKRIEKAKKEQLPPPPLLEHTCPFCRMNLPEEGEKGQKQVIARLQKRTKLGDLNALKQLSLFYKDGEYGLSSDNEKYLELVHQAASLGSAESHYTLGLEYFGVFGLPCVAKDCSKALGHFEAAAKGGHVCSRHELGEKEYFDGNKKTAVRHWRISAAAGFKMSVDKLIKCFQEGIISKESLEESMRAKHEACEAIRSEGRDLALNVMKLEGDVEGDNVSYY